LQQRCAPISHINRDACALHLNLTIPNRFGNLPSWRAFLNTPTFGAGIRLAPGAQIDDGVLEFIFLEELRFGQLLRALPRLALQGSINLPGLHTRSGPEVTYRG